MSSATAFPLSVQCTPCSQGGRWHALVGGRLRGSVAAVGATCTPPDPDEVRRSVRFGDACLFARWYDEVGGGKHVVVVVVSEAGAGRHWVITAYMARKLSGGQVEWRKS